MRMAGVECEHAGVHVSLANCNSGAADSVQLTNRRNCRDCHNCQNRQFKNSGKEILAIPRLWRFGAPRASV